MTGMQRKKLCDVRALITGATGGIGTAIAEMLVLHGAKLVLVGRDSQRLQNLSARLDPDRWWVTPLTADVSTAAGRDTIRRISDQRDVNLLINNAGVVEFRALDRQSVRAIERQIQVDLLAPILLAHHLLPILRRQPEAQILNIGSTFGSLGFAGFAPYCASKFGLRGFSEALRRELADTRIIVSYLAPRATSTKFNSVSVMAMNEELGTTMDDPDRVALAARRVIEDRESERFVGRPEHLFVRINAVLPRVVDRVLRGKLPRIRRHTEQTP